MFSHEAGAEQGEKEEEEKEANAEEEFDEERFFGAGGGGAGGSSREGRTMARRNIDRNIKRLRDLSISC